MTKREVKILYDALREHSGESLCPWWTYKDRCELSKVLQLTTDELFKYLLAENVQAKAREQVNRFMAGGIGGTGCR